MSQKLKYPLIQIHKTLYQEISPGNLSVWDLRYAKTKYGQDVVYKIKYYVGFTCDPSHIEYESIIDDKYNRYHQLTHKLEKGNWVTIQTFLEHIFGIEQYHMGLEYFWNLYTSPKQKLPFLGLVSKKKQTGKSTFLNFLALIFQGNVSVVTPDDFKGRFNEHYINSLILTSDEHYQGSDRKLVSERLKSLITEKRVKAEGKFAPAYTTTNYIKLVFAGNNEEFLTIIEPENTRYWIINVKPIDLIDYEILEKMKKEIPAFLHYLINEFKPGSKRGRLYFDPEEFQTKASQIIQENSYSPTKKKIESFIKSLFIKYPNDVIKYTSTHLAEDIKIIDKKAITKVLKNEMNLISNPSPEYYEIGCRKLENFELNSNGSFIIGKKTNATGRYFTFYREDFLK